MNKEVRNFLPDFKIDRKSSAAKILFFLENDCAFVTRSFTSRSVSFLFLRSFHGQALAPFRPSTFQNILSGRCAHAFFKAMLPLGLDFTGLEGPLHFSFSKIIFFFQIQNPISPKGSVEKTSLGLLCQRENIRLFKMREFFSKIILQKKFCLIEIRPCSFSFFGFDVALGGVKFYFPASRGQTSKK